LRYVRRTVYYTPAETVKGKRYHRLGLEEYTPAEAGVEAWLRGSSAAVEEPVYQSIVEEALARGPTVTARQYTPALGAGVARLRASHVEGRVASYASETVEAARPAGILPGRRYTGAEDSVEAVLNPVEAEAEGSHYQSTVAHVAEGVAESSSRLEGPESQSVEVSLKPVSGVVEASRGGVVEALEPSASRGIQGQVEGPADEPVEVEMKAVEAVVESPSSTSTVSAVESAGTVRRASYTEESQGETVQESDLTVDIELPDAVMNMILNANTADGKLLLDELADYLIDSRKTVANLDDLIGVLQRELEAYKELPEDERERIAREHGLTPEQLEESLEKAIQRLQQLRQSGGSTIVSASMTGMALADAVREFLKDAKAMLLSMKPVVKKEELNANLEQFDEIYRVADAYEACHTALITGDLGSCKGNSVFREYYQRVIGGDPSKATPDDVKKVLRAMASDLARALPDIARVHEEIRGKFQYVASKAKVDLMKVYKDLRRQGYWSMDTPTWLDAADFILKDLVDIVTFQPVFKKVVEEAKKLQRKGDELAKEHKGLLGELLKALAYAGSYAAAGAAGAGMAVADAILTAATGGVWLGVQLGAILGKYSVELLDPEERRELEEALKSLSPSDAALLAAILAGGALAGAASPAVLNSARNTLARLARSLAEKASDARVAAALKSLADRLSTVKIRYVRVDELPNGYTLVARATDDGVELAYVEDGEVTLSAKIPSSRIEEIAARLHLQGDPIYSGSEYVDRILARLTESAPASEARAEAALFAKYVAEEATDNVVDFLKAINEGNYVTGRLEEATSRLKDTIRNASDKMVVVDYTSGRVYLLRSNPLGKGEGELVVDYYDASIPDSVALQDPSKLRGRLRFIYETEGGRLKLLPYITVKNLESDAEEVTRLYENLKRLGLIDSLGIETVNIARGAVKEAAVPVILRGQEGSMALDLVASDGHVARVTIPLGNNGFFTAERIVGEALTPEGDTLGVDLAKIIYGDAPRAGQVSKGKYVMVQRIHLTGGALERLVDAVERGLGTSDPGTVSGVISKMLDLVATWAGEGLSRGMSWGVQNKQD
jgi:hypothetical protein